jgi:hypothetical protein
VRNEEKKMKLFSKLTAILVAGLFLFANPVAKATPIANMTHRIAGYGPVYGEYVMPISMCFFNKKIYILDLFGISIVDQKTRHLDKRFPVDNGGATIHEQWDKPSTWLSFIKGFSTGITGLMDPGSGSGLSLPEFSNGSLLKSKICFDSLGSLYMTGNNSILVYSTETGLTSRSISLPPLLKAKEDTETPTAFSFKIYNDQILLLESKSNLDLEATTSTAKMYIYSLQGELQKEITFEPAEGTSYYISSIDFFYSKNMDVFGLMVTDFSDMERCPIQFFDADGKELKTTGNINSGLVVSMGGMNAFNSSIQIALIQKNEDNSMEITKDDLIKSNKFGMMVFDIASDGTDIGIITSGPMEAMLDSRVYHIVNKEIQRLGSFSNNPGQIFGSIASTVDKDGNLYETSIGNPVINKYDKQGKFLSQIKMNLKEISSIMGLVNIFPTVTSLEIQGDFIYCTNLFPNTLSRYTISEDSWEKLYEGELFSPTMYFWFCTKMVDDRLFLLDSGTLNDGSPNLSYLDDDNTPMIVNLANSPEISEDNPPVFISMVITDKEMQFLDCANNEIWIYTRMDETFKEKIKLPLDGSNFFISFDEYVDNGWVLCDTIQSRLVHLGRNGKLIELIGSKGILATGNAKEDYEKMSDQFYRPIRVKTSGNLIYVSDLMNCRYHIISLEKKPELIWNEEEIMINNYSIYDQKVYSVTFQTASPRDFGYTLSSESPFIKIEKSSGMVSEKKISFTIMGEKLTPWTSNRGSLKVVFPDYPGLNKEIPITINAIGKVVKLQIGSEKALFDGKEVVLDRGTAPLIKSGRTFVGIRFLGETVFNAKVGYEAKTRTVTFELGSKKIELYIDKPFALVNGTKVTLDAPPFIQNGRTLVPLRFISENLDATVDYEPKTQTITISYPKK